jgi:hypothetical protein
MLDMLANFLGKIFRVFYKDMVMKKEIFFHATYDIS